MQDGMYYAKRFQDAGVDAIISRKPDAVVCATGVRPSVLPIPGFDRAAHAKDILDGGECKEKAVIIGGGSVGCETAEYLAEQGKKVTMSGRSGRE